MRADLALQGSGARLDRRARVRIARDGFWTQPERLQPREWLDRAQGPPLFLSSALFALSADCPSDFTTLTLAVNHVDP
jgi:hypothetical protein